MTYALPMDFESGPFTVSERAAKLLGPGLAQGMANRRGFDLWCSITDWFRCGEPFTTEQVAIKAMQRYGLSRRTATDLARIVLRSVADQPTEEGEPKALHQRAPNIWQL